MLGIILKVCVYKTLLSGDCSMRSAKNTLLHLFSAQASWIYPPFGRYTLTLVGDSPCARVGHSCSYLPPVGDAERGKVFIVGGADPNRSFSDVHTIDLGKTSSGGDFPGGPVVGTPSFRCREHVFDPWWGNKDTLPCGMVKKKKTRSYRASALWLESRALCCWPWSFLRLLVQTCTLPYIK